MQTAITIVTVKLLFIIFINCYFKIYNINIIVLYGNNIYVSINIIIASRVLKTSSDWSAMETYRDVSI